VRRRGPDGGADDGRRPPRLGRHGRPVRAEPYSSTRCSTDCANTTGAPVLVAHVFERGEYASFIDDKLTACSPEAWRWLVWWGQSSATGTWRRYRAEMFGPLPLAVDRSSLQPARADQ
jgi:hypothetical protein